MENLVEIAQQELDSELRRWKIDTIKSDLKKIQSNSMQMVSLTENTKMIQEHIEKVKNTTVKE